MDNDKELIKSLKELLKKDVKGVVAKGQITPADYQALDTAIDIWKDLEDICLKKSTIKAMEEYGYERGEVSGAMYPMHPMSGGDHGWAVMPMNSYADGNGQGNSGYYPMNSFERGRSPYTGRYMSRDSEVQAKLSRMMQNAGNEQERQIIQRMMNEL